MNYIKIIITVCILSHQNNLFSSGDEIDQKLSIEYTRAEKIVRHLTTELQILEKELKLKQTDYQPTLDEIKHEISLLETIIHNNPEFHNDVAKNIQGGQAYLKWFSLEYVRKKIKEETDKHNKDILKKAAKKISLEKQKNKCKTVSKKPKNLKKTCENKAGQENIITPETIKTQTPVIIAEQTAETINVQIPEKKPSIDQTNLPVCNEEPIQTPSQVSWYYSSQWYENLKNFTNTMYQNLVDMIKFVGNMNS